MKKLKRYYIILFLQILIFGCATTQYTKKLTEISEKVTPSVVLIIMYDSKGNSVSQGTGFFISENGDIITNYHVIVGTDTGVIKTSDENIYSINGVVAKDTLNDLVRLSVNIPPRRVFPLQLYFNYPKVGEKIAVIGNPFGLEHTLTVGYVSAIQEFQDYGKFIQFDASISSGSSGSPLINMNGKAIGVVTSTIKEGENLNFAIPIEYIFRLTSVKKEPIAVQKKTIEENEWYSFFPELYIPCLLLIDSGDYENAIICLETIIHSNPEDGIAYFLIGASYDELCDSEKSENAYNNAKIHLERAITENPNDTMSYFLLASCYEILSMNDEAIKAYKNIISLNPTWDIPYYYLGLLYKQLLQYTEATNYIQEAIHINPNNADAFCSLGEIYNEIGLYDDAIQSYQNAIDCDPENIETYSSIADIYHYKMHDNQSAFEYYLKILEIDPNNKRAIQRVIFIYQDAKMYRAAEEFLKKLIKRNPDDWYVHQMLAGHYREWVGEYIDFGRVTWPQEAIELYEKAIIHYEQMIRISPNYQGTYYNIGQCYSNLEKYSKAIYYYKKSIEINPTDWSPYGGLANSYREFGKYNEAIENYKLAIKYNTEDEFPGKDWSYYNIGCIYLKIRDKKNARKQYEILKSMNSSWADNLLEEINEYK